MKIQTMEELFMHELQDIYSAEKQIEEKLTHLMEDAGDAKLQKAFEEHLLQTENQILRLEKISNKLDLKLNGRKCEGIRGVLAEGDMTIKDIENPAIRDIAMIEAAQKVEHYEISAYGTLIELAKLLGQDEAAKLLKETLSEEEMNDKKLTKLAEGGINQKAITN